MKVQTTQDSLFMVSSAYSKEHVLASSAEDAIKAYYTVTQAAFDEAARDDDSVGEPDDVCAEYPVTEVRRIAASVLWVDASRSRLRSVR